ncbi:hypothetical protein ACPV5G_16500 [Photobacterium damselae]|uniref:hypothetical protein n=1 Tax=Photobacterium damselae TaxID=38293 RepID=UPI004068483A
MKGNDERPVIILQADLAPITLREYARRQGQTLEAVRAQAARKNIPTLQIEKGSTLYVNQAQMVMASLEAAGWNVKIPHDFFTV